MAPPTTQPPKAETWEISRFLPHPLTITQLPLEYVLYLQVPYKYMCDSLLIKLIQMHYIHMSSKRWKGKSENDWQLLGQRKPEAWSSSFWRWWFPKFNGVIKRETSHEAVMRVCHEARLGSILLCVPEQKHHVQCARLFTVGRGLGRDWGRS